MKCPTEHDLQMLADNALDCPTHDEIALHVRECKDCCVRYDEICSVIAFLENEVEPALPANFAVHVAAQAIEQHVAHLKYLRNIAAIAILITMSLLLESAFNSSFGTVLDVLNYDLITLELPAVYILAVVMLAIFVFAIDAIMYQRFARYTLVRKER
ncbi:MAG TPA: hypothetical protein VGK02_06955 [Candidatus Aquicultor sp.]|jgi:hypothetical protein